MVSKPTIMPLDLARKKVEAFDEWLEEQPADVKDTVSLHLSALHGVVGPDSAKLLLGEIYLTARRLIHIEKKYGDIR